MPPEKDKEVEGELDEEFEDDKEVEGEADDEDKESGEEDEEGKEEDDERDEGDEEGEEGEGEEVGSLRRDLTRLQKRVEDEQSFIERLKAENAEYRRELGIDEVGGRVPPGRRESPGAQEEDGVDYEARRMQFVKSKVAAIKQAHPDAVQDYTDEQLVQHVQASPEYEGFALALKNAQALDMLTEALYGINEKIDAQEIADPTFSMKDPQVRKYMREHGLSAKQAHTLWKAEQGEPEAKPRPKRRSELERGRPRGGPSKPKRGGGGKGSVSAEEKRAMKVWGVSEKEYQGATK